MPVNINIGQVLVKLLVKLDPFNVQTEKLLKQHIVFTFSE